MQLEVQETFSAPIMGNGWNLVDCTGVAGASAVVSSTLVLTGGGNDVWVGLDEYLACYRTQKVHGDFDIVVEVLAQTTAGNDWAKAGIMVRNDITQPLVATGYSVMAVTPGSGYAFQWDSNANGDLDGNTNTGGSITYPTYLKLSRRGYRFFGYQSADRLTWTQVGMGPSIPSANSALHVGLFNCSHAGSTINSTTFDNFEIYTGNSRFFGMW